MTLLSRPSESQALRESEDRLQLALQAGRSGVWDWDIRRDTAEVTPSYRELLGLDAGAPVNYDVWLQAVHEDDRERCRQYGERFFAGVETEWRLEFRVRTRHLGVRWHSAMGRLYREPDGTPVRFVGVETDITEKQQILEALQESEQRFRAMADGLPLIVWVHDAHGGQQFVNRTFLEYFGVTEAEASGEGWQLLMHPDDAPAYTEEFLSCVRELRPFHSETRVRDATGEWRTIESWGRPRFSESGTYLGFVGTSVDVTERRRVEQSLRDADRRKDEFLAMLGHELRNPLAAILSAMEVFDRLLPADAALRQVHGAAERQASILKRLVDDLLDSARIATGKIELQRKPVSMHEVLHGALDTARPYLVGRKHEVTVVEAGEPLVVLGDEVRLVQVLSNLLNNAAKYTPAGGRISVDLQRSGNEVVVRVRDNGVGLEGNMQDEIFGLFVQGRAPFTAEPGLGLGLALVKTLVELHGGSASALSEGAGQGSQFTIRLPLAATELLHPETAQPPSGMSRPARRILIIDDNHDAASTLGLLLRMLGHEVEEVHDGRSGLEAAQRLQPDVILLDIGLPDMSGYDVGRAVRQGDSTRRPLIVATSGFSPPAAEKAASHGIDRFLTKPVDLEQLERILSD